MTQHHLESYETRPPKTDADDVEVFGLEVPAAERIKVIREHLEPDSVPVQLLSRTERSDSDGVIGK